MGPVSWLCSCTRNKHCQNGTGIIRPSYWIAVWLIRLLQGLDHGLTCQTPAWLVRLAGLVRTLPDLSDLQDLSDHCLTYQTVAGLVRPLADLSDCRRTCQTTTRRNRLLQDLSDCYKTCQTYQIVAGFVDCHTINYQTTARFVTLLHDLSVAWHVWLLKRIVSLFYDLSDC